MFKLDFSDTYPWPVEVALIDDKGKTKKTRFVAVFRRLNRHEVESLLDETKSGEIDDAEFCRRVVEDWQEVIDADGNPLQFSPQNLDAVIEIVPVAGCIVRSWFDSIAEGARKN